MSDLPETIPLVRDAKYSTRATSQAPCICCGRRVNPVRFVVRVVNSGRHLLRVDLAKRLDEENKVWGDSDGGWHAIGPECRRKIDRAYVAKL